MNSLSHKINFSTLLPMAQANRLLQKLNDNVTNNDKNIDASPVLVNGQYIEKWANQWCQLSDLQEHDDSQQGQSHYERAATDWLIQVFNTLFAEQNVILARSDGEPEYFPAQNNKPARIEFAHGFFQSALHEIGHFCIAGERRRQLADFGYWYAADGRSEAQQQAFERVEIKPQALECLFTLACGRPFQVSQDNLFADFDTSGSTFAKDVYLQAKDYITKPRALPRDAKILLKTLLRVCSNNEVS